MMRVCISVGGRFHAFNLAHQLYKQGHLQQLITSYPKYEVMKYGVPQEKVTSLLFKEILSRINARIPIFGRWRAADYYLNDWFDQLAARALVECDICTAWSSFGLYTIKKAKSMGAITVIERGSAHIQFQREILRDEYARFGIKLDPVLPEIVDKELQEYTEADYIVVPSDFAKNTFLERHIASDKLIYIPYGVDLSGFQPIPTKSNIFRVIYVGTMSIRKGIPYLLEAFKQLKLPYAELWLVGSLTEEILPIFAKYTGIFVHKGPFPQKQLTNYYSQASVFTLCSIEDGFGMVVPQAMACGLPIICTTNTGGPDIVRDGVEGFVIPIRDVDALKEKILYLYDNQDYCREMGQNALKRVQSSFTWEDYGNAVVMSYKNCLNKVIS